MRSAEAILNDTYGTHCKGSMCAGGLCGVESMTAIDTAKREARDESRTEIENLREALAALLKFNKELCEDVGVSSHYPSADGARRLLDSTEPARERPPKPQLPPNRIIREDRAKPEGES